MADAGSPPSVDELLQHVQLVRRLALSLCPDVHAAEDAMQDTWAAVLRNPPAHRENLAGFFARLLRNALGQRSRGDVRRAARERAVAGPAGAEFAEAAADAAQRAELHKALVTLVLQLPEPQQGLVLLHYFDGLSIDELAQRHRTSADAVRAHLRRARERLRAGLERADHRVQGALALLWASRPVAPPVPLATPAAATAAALCMISLKTKLLLCGLAAAAAIAVWVGLAAPPVATPSTAVANDAAPAASAFDTAPRAPSPVTSEQRTAVVAAAGEPTNTARTTEALRLRVEHTDGSEATITALRCRLVPGVVDVDCERIGPGTFRCWPPDGWGQLVVRLEGPRVHHPHRMVLPRDVGPNREAVVQLPDTRDLRVRLLHHVTKVVVPDVVTTLSYVATARSLVIPRAPRSERSDAAGVMTFAALELGVYTVTVGDDHRVVQPGLIEVEPLAESIDVLVASDDDWRIRGRVVAASDPSRGIADVLLSVLGSEVTRSDAEGRFELPGSLRQTAGQTYLRLFASPPPGNKDLAKVAAGPFAWHEQDIVVELPTTRHRLEVRTPDGRPLSVPVSYRVSVNGRLGSGTWQLLASQVPGNFDLPWDEQWSNPTWLRLEVENAAGQVRHVRFEQLPHRTAGDTIVHCWTVPVQRPVQIVVQETPSQRLGGAEVDVVYQAAWGPLHNAVPTADYFDLSETNPMFDKRVPLLARGVTGADGTLVLSAAWQPGVGLRCHHPLYGDVIVEVTGAEDPIVVTMTACGSLRGAIREGPGAARIMVIPDVPLPGGPRDWTQVLPSGDFHFAKLPVGTYSIALAVGGRHLHELGRVEIQRGIESEFRTTASGLGALTVELVGDGLAAGDRIEARIERLPWGGDRVTVADAKRTTLQLASGTYRLMRVRFHRDLGHDAFVLADAPLVVRSGQQRFTPQFPSAPGRVRLLADGKPMASSWVQIEEAMEAVVKTDTEGWAAFACWPGNVFTLRAVRFMSADWRPTGPRWQVTQQDEGQDVAAAR
ncbi:MAG TPA: RNA polymerase sigma factor [Planctomycetota bacterium]